MTNRTTIAIVADGWGATKGGINAFNADLCTSLATVVGSAGSVICLTTDATSEQDRVQAAARGVELIELTSRLDSERACEEEVSRLFGHARKPDWWIGHDVITGPCASMLARAAGAGRVAVFQHMDYAAYQGFKRHDGDIAKRMADKQRASVQSADLVFGVGPKLTKAARRLRNRADDSVVEIIPGLSAVLPSNKAADHFQVITFGRMGAEDDRIKQGRLAAISAARASKRIWKLQRRDVWLTVIGFPESESEYAPQLRKLERLVNTEAKRAVNIRALRYTKNRQELFDELAQCHASLMLSLHEGFGLTGWEAIAAAVPLVVSTHSGLFDLLHRDYLDSYVSAIDVCAPQANRFYERDINAVASALEQISVQTEEPQKRAEALRAELLRRGYSWENAGRKLCMACDIALPPASSRSGVAVSDDFLLKREAKQRALDDDMRRCLSVHQQRLKAKHADAGIDVAAMSRHAQSIRAYYTGTQWYGVTAAPITQASYSELIARARTVADDFRQLPDPLIESGRLHGMYFHSGVWDGIDAAKSSGIETLPQKGADNAAWGYEWEVIGRLLATMKGFLEFSPDDYSDGYSADGWLSGKPIARPATLLAWASRPKGTTPAIDVFAVEDHASNLRHIARFVARKAIIGRPQLVARADDTWSLFAADGSRVYEWRLSYSVPIAEYGLEGERVARFLAARTTDDVALFGINNRGILKRLDHNVVLGRVYKSMELAVDAKSGDLFALRVRTISGGMDVLCARNMSCATAPTIVCVLGRAEAQAPSAESAPKFAGRLAEEIGKFDASASLMITIPTDASRTAHIQRMQTNHLAPRSLAALTIVGKSGCLQIAIVDLKCPSRNPRILTTDQRTFDVVVIERPGETLLLATLLPGGNTQHCIALWRWDSARGSFELAAIDHPCSTGSATDLNVVADPSGPITALYRLQNETGTSLWQWTWPTQTLTRVGQLPAELVEGESALSRLE